MKKTTRYVQLTDVGVEIETPFVPDSFTRNIGRLVLLAEQSEITTALYAQEALEGFDMEIVPYDSISERMGKSNFRTLEVYRKGDWIMTLHNVPLHKNYHGNSKNFKVGRDSTLFDYDLN